MVKNSKNLFLKFIFLVSIIALVSAFFIEYILGHQPCNLCICLLYTSDAADE